MAAIYYTKRTGSDIVWLLDTGVVDDALIFSDELFIGQDVRSLTSYKEFDTAIVDAQTFENSELFALQDIYKKGEINGSHGRGAAILIVRAFTTA